MTGPALTIADGFAQLVAHVLAHVPLAQAGNLHDPRYVAWARPRMSAADREVLEHDAQLLARCWASDRRLDLVHGFCALHRGLDEFLATRSRPLGEIDATEVRAPALLERLAELPAAELLHATLALLADRYPELLDAARESLERARADMAPELERLAAAIPSFAAARVELVWALGRCGRAFEDRLLVGAPAVWSGCSPGRQAMLAAHEHLVARAGAGDYASGEWSALTTLARRLHEHGEPESIDAHARWLAELDLTDLLAQLVGRGRLTADEAEVLERQPGARARRLAAR